jgi:regulator of RNase E activity RraA
VEQSFVVGEVDFIASTRQVDIPLHFGGVNFLPGDYLVCDNNGIVVNETPMDK